MKVYILDYGWLEGDINWMAALKNFATKNNKTVSSCWTRFPEYGVLIETGERWILYDTGSHPDDYDRSIRFPFYYREGQGIISQLNMLGLQSEDVGTVVLSHLHDDHAGNIHLFPHADIYIDWAEYTYMEKYRSESRVFQNLKEMERIHLFKEDFYIDTNIEILRLPGHSPGLAGMYLHSKAKPMFFVSDAVNMADNYGIPPKAAVGLFDERLYFLMIENIRRVERETGAQIIFGHDFEQFEKMKKCPEHYEL